MRTKVVKGSESRAAVAVVNARGAARWRGGHPWIYRSDVKQAPQSEAGVVEVVATSGNSVGVALWSPKSTISLRMLTAGATEVEPVRVLRDRIAVAASYREGLRVDGDAYRLVHAEADGLPSLVVDRYGDYLVVQLLSAGLESLRDEVVAALREYFAPVGILARNDVPVRGHENLPRSTELLWGRVPRAIEVREGAVRYLVDPWTGQKTGAFLDQRENRLLAGALAGTSREPAGDGPGAGVDRAPSSLRQGRCRALDCFTYHGSFALHMAVAGADVVALDSSRDALDRAAASASLNGVGLDLQHGNAFDFLRTRADAGERYDLIVLDPPAFAKSRSSLAGALRGYKEINLRAMRLLAPGGQLMTFSCSYHVSAADFRGMLEDAAADAGRALRWLGALSQARDHPVLLQVPETGYLKGALIQAV